MHRFSDEEMTERASLYALGALSLWEARAFEEHIEEGCKLCAAELQSFEETVSSLALAASEAEAPTSAREKLQALVVEETHADSAASKQAASQPLITLRADEGEWYEVAKGMSVKQLFFDRETGMVMTLLKMEPGTRIPLHRHRGIEQCYVIEGDFHADNQSLGAGDFHCAQAGSTHQPVYTVDGALVLIVAPKDYDVLERH